MANAATNWRSGFSLVLSGGKGGLFDVFIYSIFVNLLMLTSPLFMLQVYDRVLSSRSVPTLVALSVLVCALFLVMAVIDYARTRLWAIAGRRRVLHYEPAVFSELVENRAASGGQGGMGGASADGQAQSGTALLRNLDSYAQIFQSPALLGYMDIGWMPIYLGAIYFLHPILGLFAIAFALFIVFLSLLNHWMGRRQKSAMVHASNQAFDIANEVISGSEIVGAQGMKSSLYGKWQEARNRGAHFSIIAGRQSARFTSLTKSLRMLIASMMLALGAYFALQGAMSPGAIIAGSILLGRALEPTQIILGQYAAIQSAALALGQLERALELQGEEEEPMQFSEITGELSANNLNVLSDKHDMLLSSMSFHVPPGKALGVIGLSGSGKSTLARAILGLIPLAAGEVRLGGIRVDQIGRERFGQSVGYLPQDVHLFSGSIAQNIARMAPEYDDAKVIKAAKAANVHELITDLPEGYKSEIGLKSGLRLSGGQRQRIALARALYGDPVLLVLDEPNSALDDAGSRALNNAILELKARGGSAIIMTHRPSAIGACDELLVIENGRTRAYGPRDKVLQSMVKNASNIRRAIDEKADGKAENG